MSATNKEIEPHAQMAQDNFTFFLDQANFPFAILKGRNFEFIFANAAYVQLMNGRKLLGRTLDEAIPELKGQVFLVLLQKVFDTGVPYHTSEIAATALFAGNSEPATRYFNISYTPYHNQQGLIEGILAAGHDITAQVELKMKEAKQVLNMQTYSLFMQAPVGFSLVMGDEHVLKLANATGLSLAGKGDEIIGKRVTEIIPGIESQGYIELLNRVKQNGESFNLKERPVTLFKNGREQTMYVNVIYQPYYEGANIAGVLSISTDVTEQVSARKESEEMRERFETMANNIPNLAWIAKADGWIFWYNNRWYEYTGTTPAEMEGWNWQSVHDPEQLPQVLEAWQLSISTGQPFEMVFPIKGADKVFRPFLTRVIPLRNNEGKIINWIGTNTDITRQKELERLKDDFLSMASHELKTPVTTIKAYSYMIENILEEKADRETLGMMKRMSAQVDRLTRLIEDLLDITKINKGKLIYNEAFFDFNQLVKEVVEDMQNTTLTHEIENFLCGGEKIFGDKDKLGQVLNNLISNAIKYSPGARKIVVNTDLLKNGIQLSVKDFGIGISAQEQKKIFQQFYRVTGDNQSTFPGMGIGLYICAEIIAGHGGKIWLESIIGKGSVFYIWLPFDHRTAVRNI